jgi:hypothetical protein
MCLGRRIHPCVPADTAGPPRCHSRGPSITPPPSPARAGIDITAKREADGPIRPAPAYPDAATRALSERLEDARERRRRLRDAGLATDDLDREIVEVRRQFREGGRLRAGDALDDGRYLLVQEVGRGGFAVVWNAYDRREQQHVAIKVLHTNLAGDPLRRERFFRGARAMRDLGHAAVVRVLEPEGEDGGFHYFVMELLTGGDLRQAVLANRIANERVLPLLLQVTEAIASAHARGWSIEISSQRTSCSTATATRSSPTSIWWAPPTRLAGRAPERWERLSMPRLSAWRSRRRRRRERMCMGWG